MCQCSISTLAGGPGSASPPWFSSPIPQAHCFCWLSVSFLWGAWSALPRAGGTSPNGAGSVVATATVLPPRSARRLQRPPFNRRPAQRLTTVRSAHGLTPCQLPEGHMKRRKRSTIFALLVKAGWKPRRRGWTVPCCDRDGRWSYAEVSIAEHGPQITVDADGGVAVFDPLAVGQLRAALRDAIELYVRLDQSAREGIPAPRSHPGAAPTPHREVPGGRHVAQAAGRVAVVLLDDEGEPSGRHALRSTPMAMSEAA
ncbi:hypothetical protein YIM_07440 [Amycolatopsis sp. YIM 10]|nr:hypothetical protein YIM_07440 [Amycolatopsis sp. YIM 10]